jgi:hypothetical protein
MSERHGISLQSWSDAVATSDAVPVDFEVLPPLGHPAHRIEYRCHHGEAVRRVT